MKGITNFDSNSPRQTIAKYKIESSRRFEVRYLKSLYKSKYRIIKPIKVLVENPKTSKDEYIIEIKEGEVFIYSHGKTLQKAVWEIRLHLVELYEKLANISYTEMGPVLVDTIKFLKEHIKEK